MTTGMLTDVLADLGVTAWKGLSAITVLATVAWAIAIMSYFYNVARKTGTHRLEETWSLHITMQVACGLLSIVTLIGALGIVLRSTWVEQITSAFVIGQGFALRPFVESFLWGWVARSHDHGDARIKASSRIRVPTSRRDVEGHVEHLDVLHVYIRGDDDELFVLPWSSMQMYDILSHPSSVKDHKDARETQGASDDVPDFDFR